jgi:glycosyltransferase involved in cell wall biosynthesis
VTDATSRPSKGSRRRRERSAHPPTEWHGEAVERLRVHTARMPASPMRIAIIGSRGHPSTYGGFETFVRRFAPYLAAEGIDVTVYGRRATLWPSSSRIDGVRVVNTPGIDRSRSSTLSYGLTSTIHAAFSRYDAVLVLNVANGYWLPLLKLFRVPTLVNVDGIEWERGKWSPLGRAVFKAAARITARVADRIVVDSRAVGRYWSDVFGVSSLYIPYGADVSDDDDCDRISALGLDPGGYLLVVARLVPENNVDLFLDALDLVTQHPPVVVAGSAVAPSALEARLERLHRERSSFTWLGHVADQELLNQLWRHCGLYVHGHSVGGTNPSLLHAMGAGGPTVALNTVYNAEVLGPDWPTYADGKPEELAQLIESLMAFPQEREKLRERGRAIVEERYRWQDVLAEHAQALRELAGK